MTKNEDITKTDTNVDGIKVRVWRERGVITRYDVYNTSGWRIGQYKTERGMRRAVNRQWQEGNSKLTMTQVLDLFGQIAKGK